MKKLITLAIIFALIAVIPFTDAAKKVQPAKCIDTDGGLDLSTKGYVNSYDSAGNHVEGFTDNCWNGKMREGYCENNKIKVKEFACQFGCSINGVCNSAPIAKETPQKTVKTINVPSKNTLTPTSPSISKLLPLPKTVVSVDRCVDTDGGKSYYTKGYVNIYDSAGKSVKGFTDNCYNSKTVLREGFCENGKIEVKQFTCPKGCSNGACK